MKKAVIATALVTLSSAALLAQAGGSHSGGHGDDMDMGSMSMDSLNMNQMKALPVEPGDAPAGHSMHGGHGGHGGHHAHDSWVEPPAEYHQHTFSGWDNFERAKAGMAVYRENCASCHGLDGRGTGPLAKKLQHPPADLTNHFHMMPGKGDQYLFWRVSEGGQVEPFASANSAMPAFKHSLTEQQRWDVLAYLHQAFHDGFKNNQMSMNMEHHEQH